MQNGALEEMFQACLNIVDFFLSFTLFYIVSTLSTLVLHIPSGAAWPLSKDRYLQGRQISLAIYTNTFSKIGQIHFTIWTNLVYTFPLALLTPFKELVSQENALILDTFKHDMHVCDHEQNQCLLKRMILHKDTQLSVLKGKGPTNLRQIIIAKIKSEKL